MKKTTILILGWIIFLFLSITLTSAQTLYQQDSLLLQLDVNGKFELIPTGTPTSLQEVSAELLLFPRDDLRQKVTNLDSDGLPNGKFIGFEWDDGRLEEKNYGYTALIQTDNRQVEITAKIPYPLTDQDVQGYENYLQPTKTIDSDNPTIIAKATELAEGEEDLFKVSFKLASWVEENVNYDLNTITETAALPASWVLEHREGVCDEMTSLFVAMARSLGIPARFVSGISHTTSPLFAEPWQPHGWAEVYFPNIGWVSFDITFGEYGYVDVTHIKLRDGFDPTEPATLFEWLGKNVDLKAEMLNFDLSIVNKGSFIPEKIQLEQEILDGDVGPGSYNLIKGVLKNTEEYYAATTLTLAVPQEIEVSGRNKRTILLAPKEVRETSWVIKTPGNLPSTYIYTFPVLIYSEKNITTEGSFSMQQEGTIYSREEIEKLVVADEEKTYSRKITFDCTYPRTLKLGEQGKVACSLRNRGTINLHNLEFCLGDVCEIFDLPLNQERKKEITLEGEKAGQKKMVITAKNEEVEKKAVFEYSVIDAPKLNVEIDAPAELTFGQAETLTLIVDKKSFSPPRNVLLTLELPGLEHNWEIEVLSQKIELPFLLENLPLTKNNQITITAVWKDEEGTTYSLEKQVIVPGKARNLGEKIKMFFNGIFYFFS